MSAEETVNDHVVMGETVKGRDGASVAAYSVSQTRRRLGGPALCLAAAFLRVASAQAIVRAVAGPGQASPDLSDQFQQASEAVSGFHVTPIAMGFYRPDEVPRPSPKGGEAVKAVVLMQARYNSCSGIRVSKTGYILTAAHCVDDLLPDTPQARGEDASTAPRSYGGSMIDAKVGGSPLYLVAAGRGRAEHSYGLRELPGLSKNQLMSLGREISGDWAIVKANNAATAPCAEVAPRSVEEGEPVWLLGYPSNTTRGNGHQSDAGAESAVAIDRVIIIHGPNTTQVYATYGDIHLDVYKKESKIWKRLNMSDRASFDRAFQPGIAAGDLVLSDADAYKGMSGGPVIDAQGAVVAVTSWAESTRENFKDNSTIGVSVKRIFDDLRRLSLRPEDVFDCPR